MYQPNPAQRWRLIYHILKGSFLLFFAAIFISSCTTPKNTYYFKTVPRDTIIQSVNPIVESKIRKTDLLAINISSLNPEEDRIYNAPVTGGGTVSTSVGTSNGYLVDAQGNIQLHKLGYIHAEGMTRAQLKNKIQKDIEPYLKDPVVTVRYLNHRVTVLGNVSRPSVVQMPEERLSLFEVLSTSGDLTLYGKSDNILVIRDTENGKQLKRINLEDHSIFNSDWFYLQPDDVVYVEPNDKKIKDEERAKKQQIISIGLSAISVAVILLDRIFR